MKRGKKINNRLLYSLITLGILFIFAVGVYAVSYVASGAGHPYTEITTCGANQVLKMNSAGTAWTCGTDSAGSSPTKSTILALFTTRAIYRGNSLCGLSDLSLSKGSSTCTTVLCAGNTIGTARYYRCDGSCHPTVQVKSTCDKYVLLGYVIS